MKYDRVIVAEEAEHFWKESGKLTYSDDDAPVDFLLDGFFMLLLLLPSFLMF